MIILIDRNIIDKAKAKIGDDMANIIAKELNIDDFDDKNLKGRCPFHGELTASFIWNKKALSFHCFGLCGRNYDIIDVFMSKGLTYIESVQKLFELANIKYAFGEHKVQTKHQYNYPKEVECNNKDRVYKYLSQRKISAKTADYLDIREDEHGNCVFNYYDLNDTLSMVKYRPSHKTEKKEPKNWCQVGSDTTPLLYNMNRINIDQPLVIFSGELDCAAGIEAGWLNSTSIPLGDGNLQWIKENFEWLEQFKEIIICPDNDESGMKYCKTVIPMLGSWRCKIATIPDTYEKPDGTKVHVKDANEFLYYYGADKLLDAIIHAKDSPIPSLIDFSTIKERDISEMDGVKTGFAEIDNDLYKLFYGSFTIVSGYPSSGKTSFLYSLICNAIDQDVNSYIYSRELPEWMSKSWILHMFAGRRNHNEYKNKDGELYYKVPQDVKDKIDKYYNGKLVFYRDDYPNDAESIIESMTSSARKYGSKLFLLDNLMTIDLGGSEEMKYEKQTEFVNNLIAFSTKYQVAVILVCHPNKQSDTMQNVGMYQISGSSNLINLAHRAIGLRRITKRERDGYTDGKITHAPIKYDVVISVIKDRFGGKNQAEYKMYYDNVDRRFYSNQEEYDKNYKWDKNTYSTPLIAERLCDEDEVYGKIKR